MHTRIHACDLTAFLEGHAVVKYALRHADVSHSCGGRGIVVTGILMFIKVMELRDWNFTSCPTVGVNCYNL
jgi:hypothetical protein